MPRAETPPAIVWFRNDVRISDHVALTQAVAQEVPIIPLYVHDPAPRHGILRGHRSQWWLYGALAELDRALRARDSRLILRRGSVMHEILEVAHTSGARSVMAHADHLPGGAQLESELRDALSAAGVELHLTPPTLLVDPAVVHSGSGRPYRVFAAFERAVARGPAPGRPVPEPRHLRSPARWPGSHDPADLGFEGIRESVGLRDISWKDRLGQFIATRIDEYGSLRDRPDVAGTSLLSPWLASGEVSPREIWNLLDGIDSPGASAFRRQILWREFSHHLVRWYPKMTEEPIDATFDAINWRTSERDLQAWQQGRTGYPIVDAGMRQLAQTGWLHNRVRMIAASFLCKHLLLPWQEGENWFWEMLVDADLANNAVNWQWVAGSGADAAPFFRIFNPTLQGEKHDPVGDYVRRWVPELEALPSRWIHKPWQAPYETLAAAGIKLGATYPTPTVDHTFARQRALAARQR